MSQYGADGDFVDGRRKAAMTAGGGNSRKANAIGREAILRITPQKLRKGGLKPLK
jgi:hypothetical protein